METQEKRKKGMTEKFWIGEEVPISDAVFRLMQQVQYYKSCIYHCSSKEQEQPFKVKLKDSIAEFNNAVAIKNSDKTATYVLPERFRMNIFPND